MSVLDWSKSRNSTNPRWPPDAILNYKKAFIENDRESSDLDSRHLQATFLKKISFLELFSISKSNAHGLYWTLDPSHDDINALCTHTAIHLADWATWPSISVQWPPQKARELYLAVLLIFVRSVCKSKHKLLYKTMHWQHGTTLNCQ